MMIYANENHLVNGEIKCSDCEFSSVEAKNDFQSSIINSSWHKMIFKKM